MSLNVTLTQRFKPLTCLCDQVKDWILPRLLHIEALWSLHLSSESTINRNINLFVMTKKEIGDIIVHHQVQFLTIRVDTYNIS
jgi:hypothetical protein